MFESSVYVERRKKLAASIRRGLILLPGNVESSINYKDNLYPFRQDSTFLYFFGMKRPELMGVIDAESGDAHMFGDDLTTEQMVWTGFQEPLRMLSEKAGVSKVHNKAEIFSFVKEAQKAKREIHFLPPYRPEQVYFLHQLTGLPVQEIGPQASLQLIHAVVAQRAFKSAEEVNDICRAIDTTVKMQMETMLFAKPGMTESDIAGRIQGIAIAEGGHLSFPAIITQKGQYLHNSYSRAELKDGNLVLCDCGAETSMHYCGDLTRTFPVGKKFTTQQREVYDIVLEAHQSAVSKLAPGILFRDVHLHACLKLTEGLIALGIMKGNAEEAVRNGAHALFFPCGLGHMIGLDVHDMENLGEEHVGYDGEIQKSTAFGLKSLRLGRNLQKDFVITVEPGLYFNPDLMDEWQASKRCSSFIDFKKLQEYRHLTGIRVEENFLITENGSRLLGKTLPKNAVEIEGLRS